MFTVVVTFSISDQLTNYALEPDCIFFLLFFGGGCFCSGQVEVGGNNSRKISRNSDVLYYKHLNYQVFESLLW